MVEKFRTLLKNETDSTVSKKREIIMKETINWTTSLIGQRMDFQSSKTPRTKSITPPNKYHHSWLWRSKIIVERKKIIHMVSPPVRETGLSWIFLSSGKSKSQSGPTFIRKADNQTVKAKVSVKGISVCIAILSGVQHTYDTVGDFFSQSSFLKITRMTSWLHIHSDLCYRSRFEYQKTQLPKRALKNSFLRIDD